MIIPTEAPQPQLDPKTAVTNILNKTDFEPVLDPRKNSLGYADRLVHSIDARLELRAVEISVGTGDKSKKYRYLVLNAEDPNMLVQDDFTGKQVNRKAKVALLDPSIMLGDNNERVKDDELRNRFSTVLDAASKGEKYPYLIDRWGAMGAILADEETSPNGIQGSGRKAIEDVFYASPLKTGDFGDDANTIVYASVSDRQRGIWEETRAVSSVRGEETPLDQFDLVVFAKKAHPDNAK